MPAPSSSANPASLAELVNVGESFCLFRRDNHALALLNDSAATMLASSFDGLDTSRFEPRDGRAHPSKKIDGASPCTEALMTQLRSEGFLAAPAPHRPCLPLLPEPHLGHSLVLDEVYRFADGPPVRLKCVDEQLAGLLAAALTPLRAAESAAHEIDMLVSSDERSFGVWRQRVAIATGLDRVTARRICLQAMSMALLPPDGIAALLHASCVALQGRALVLAGATGSGKSTLTMALVGIGATYLADDLTPLHRSGKSVLSFPLAASVKSGSWSALQAYFPELQDLETYRVGELRVRYVDPSPAGSAPVGTGNVAVGALVFPAFTPGDSETSLQRLTPEEALSLLVGSGSEVVGANRSIVPLTTFLNETPAWRLAFPDTASGLQAVQKIMGAP